MSVYLVTYDLRAPGRNYQALYDALKKLPHCHGLESVWFVQSNSTPQQVRDYLRQHLDANDRVFVSEVTGAWASYNMQCADWLTAKGL